MLPILARTAGGTLMRQGGKAAASKLLGRKTKMKPGKAQPGGQEVGKERGALAVRPQTAMVPTSSVMQDEPGPGPETKSTDPLESINNTLIEIKSILRGTLAAEKKEQDDKEKAAKREDRKRQEQKLETKQKVKGKTKVKMPKAPRMGILSWITNFITTLLLGYFAVRMVEFVPFLSGIVKTLLSVGEFLTDVGIGLIDAFATFVDIGYKAYDFTRGALKDLGGEDLVSVFDGVMKAVDTVFTLLTVAMLANSMGLTGPKVTPKPKIKPKPGQGLRPKVTKSGGGPANRPDIRNPLRQKPKVTTTGGKTTGKPDIRNPFRQRPQVTTSGTKPGFRFSNPFKGIKGINPKDFATGAASAGIGVLLNLLLDYGFSLLDAKQIEDQARKYREATPEKRKQVREKYTKLAAKYNERSQSLFNKITTVGGLLGPSTDEQLARKFEGALAAFDVVDANPTQEFNEGGKVKPVRRSFSATTVRRQKKSQRQKPTYERIQLPNSGNVNIDDDNKSPWWDFLGLFKGDELGAGGLRLAQRAADVGNAFGENKYFGPILSVASKFILGQKPDEKDYRNVGYGLNLLIGEGIDDKKIRQGMQAFAEGGMVQTAMSGVDISKWVSDTFRKDISDAINRNYEMGTSETNRKISKEESKEKEEGSTSGPGSAPGVRDPATGELMGGTATGAIEPSELYKQIGANEEQWNIYRNSVALIESGGDYSIPGGSGMYYDGRYQMGGPAKTDGAKYAGLPDPGHSDDPNAQVRAAFRADKELQEALFTGFTLANHTYLMRNETYKNSDIERKLQILGYAHNQGMGNAEDWIVTGVVGKDGFGTKGTKYTDLIAANFKAQKSGGDLNLASGAVEMKDLKPSPGQTEPTKITGKGSEAAENLLKDFPQIKARDTAQQIFASGLGFYLKKSGAGRPGTGDFGDPPGGDMEHPDHGGVVASHAGTGHYRGVALDLGANSATSGSYTEDQKTLWPYISDFLHKYGLHVEPFVPQVIHGPKESFSPKAASSFADGAHHNHFHVEFHKGGVVGGDGEVPAVLKSGEVVIDTDSSEYGPIKNMLLAVNQASGKEGVLSAIQDYAPYDMRGEQTVVVPQPAPQQPPAPQYGSSSMMNFSSVRSENFSEFLDFQG